MSELGPNEERWLDALRGADEPTAADKSRVRAAVLASIGVGVGVGVAGVGAAAAAASTSAGAAGAGAAGAGTVATVGATAAKATAAATAAKSGGLFGSIAWKIGLAVVSLVAVSGATTAVVRHQRQAATSITQNNALAATRGGNEPTNARNAPAAPVAPGPAASDTASGAPDPSGAVNDDPATPAVPAAPEAPAASGSPAVAPPVVAVAPKARTDHHAPSTARGAASASELEAEVALLNQAQQARAHGDLDGALRALGKHAKEHPRGVLAVERDSLRALVACEAKRPEARALATKFVSQNPSSPLVSRVKKACLLDP